MNQNGYYTGAIGGFGDRDTELLCQRGRPKRIDPRVQAAALRKLKYLDHAMSLDDLKSPPGNRLEALRGRHKGMYSIRVNNRWRLIFRWRGQRAYDVSVVDYH